MSRPTSRPATRADFDQLIDEPLPFRVKAIALEHEGHLLAVGGFGFMPDGTIGAFLIRAPGLEQFKVSLHRAGLWMMAEAKRMGLRRIVALADLSIGRSVEWLLRLGFKEMNVDGEKVYVWTGSQVG